MRKNGTESLLLTHAPDVRYLCGFTGSNALLLVLARSTVLLTDSRYTSQARDETAGTRVRVVIAKKLLPTACALLERSGASAVGYDASQTTVAALERLEASLPDGYGKAARRRFFVPLPVSPVASLRERKDARELGCMEEAATLGCRVFEASVAHLRPGVPEQAVAAELEYAARRMGAEGMSFPTIVAGGRRSSLPHGTASSEPLPRRGFVTLDFGVMLRGYCSDMTRTVFLGTPNREESETYAAVLAAEQAGVAAVRAGVTGAAVDQAARSALRRKGLGRYFAHSTGHGVGLAIHEGPRLGAKSEDVLAEGMVVTVEPGVYLPNRFGIRIEDMVAVGAEKARVLTTTSRELLALPSTEGTSRKKAR